jgi:hypothetical protein
VWQYWEARAHIGDMVRSLRAIAIQTSCYIHAPEASSDHARDSIDHPPGEQRYECPKQRGVRVVIALYERILIYFIG